jgi:hypothetical protein
MGTKILNGLPVELKNEMNPNVFKKKLKGIWYVTFFILHKNFLTSSHIDSRWINSPVLFLMSF